jgi:hypothetical protein
MIFRQAPAHPTQIVVGWLTILLQHCLISRESLAYVEAKGLGGLPKKVYSVCRKWSIQSIPSIRSVPSGERVYSVIARSEATKQSPVKTLYLNLPLPSEGED